MFKKINLLVCLLICLSTAAFATPLKVWPSLLPENESDLGRHPVSIHFNQPVTGLGENSAFASNNCPFTITPAIAGECHYSGTQTIVFEPTENWPVATRYTLTLPADFTSGVTGEKLGKAYTASFYTARPRVEQVKPFDGEHWLSLNPTLYVSFSMPVKNADKFVVLWNGNKKVPVSVRAVTEGEFKQNFNYGKYENTIAVTPTETLRKGTQYTLTLREGLPAAAGTQGLAQAYNTRFYTYPVLAVNKVEKDGCLPFVPSIEFSSPVRLREVLRSASVTPQTARKRLDEQDLDTLGNEFVDKKTGAAYFRMPLTFLDLKPGEAVEVTLNGGLQDIYGNKLGKDYTFTVTNNGYCPAVNLSGGFGVLESYLSPKLPVDLMNVAEVPVEAARFNKDNFIPFDQLKSEYCARKPLSDMTFNSNYTFKDVKNKTNKTFFDLTYFKPTPKDSIIFSQVKVKRNNEDCWISSTDNITDVGVTFKTSPSSILVWATSLKAGTPLADMQVELRGSDNTLLWSGKTNSDGLALAPGWKDLNAPVSDWGAPVIYAFVTSKGGNAVVSSVWNDGLEPWRFNIDYDYNPQANVVRSYVFTERGIYRTGENVYIKGVVRDQQAGNWAIPSEKKGRLVITDARGKEVFKNDITLSQNGSFDSRYEVPANAPTGYWNIRFTPLRNGKAMESNSFYTTFQVEAVKQADFSITFMPRSEDYFGGEKATYNVAAAYNFGAPMAGAKAKWTFRQEYAFFQPEGYKDYVFTPYFLREDASSYDGKLLASASGELDKEGTLSIAAQLPEVTQVTRVYGEIGVTSPANQELFSRNSVLVHPGDFYIGAKPVKDDFTAGKPVTLDIIALTPSALPTEAYGRAEIYREQWFSVRKTGLSGRLEWVSDKKIEKLPAQVVDITVKGTQLSFVPKEGGWYFVKISAQDAHGNTVTGGTDVFVAGKGDNYWKKSDDDLLVLKQDKSSYKVGQKARIAIESPYPQATALISVERAGILDTWVAPVNAGASSVTIPIKDNYLPNVYVNVMLVRGRTADPVKDRVLDLGKPQIKTGYVNLNVVPDKKKIDTSVTTASTVYRPGDTVTVNLATKVKGKAVPAEVAVMVVDEGMLALTDYKTPDLFNYFYGAQPLSVSTMDNRAYVIGQRSFGEKGENRGGGGSAGAKLGGVDLRSNFSFVPYFQAAVETNKKGKASVSFTLPDNLTKFRVMAVALTTDEFGSGETALYVSKPLMVTPHLPRFARKNDTFTCGAVVYNFGDKSGTLVVEAKADGAVSLDGKAEQGIFVPLGEARHVGWTCKADKEGKADFSVIVAGANANDGVKASLDVVPVEKAQTLATYSNLGGSEKSELLEKPASADPQGDNKVSAVIASTALINLKGALSYLLAYPYDCLEQKMSKILPVITSEKLIADFRLGDVEAYKKQAQEVLGELPLYQAQTGGFAYWQGGAADAYVTTYALETAWEAQKAGYEVPQESINKALNWLETAFNKDTENAYAYSVAENKTARAYAVYVLSLYGRNTDGAFNTLYADRSSLNVSAAAYLLKAAYAGKRSRQIKDTLITQLSRHFVYTAHALYIQEKAMPWLHINSVSATALTLSALLNERPVFDSAFEMAAWLLAQVNADGSWSNTRDNALMVQTLGAYYTLTERATPKFEAFVTQGYQQLLSAQFEGRSLDNKTVEIPFDKIYKEKAETSIAFIKHGTGTLFYTLSQTYIPRVFNKGVNGGFLIKRVIRTLDGKPATELHAGERYQVVLQISTTVSRSFVVAEDFIPAGFEIVNTTLDTESQEQAQAMAQANASGFSRAERYDDHVAAFADFLPAGTHEYAYLVTALTDGEFAYPAAWVSQMYDPSVFGRTKTTQLVIK